MIDENSAPYIAPNIGTTCYHCPNTNCDGHYYLSGTDLGVERICPRCGLPVTIGQRTAEPARAPTPEQHTTAKKRSWLIVLGWAVLIAVLVAVAVWIDLTFRY